MTPRIAPRSRPRKTSVDFSRLWWLVETEAALKVLFGIVPYVSPPRELRGYYARSLRAAARLRALARARLGLLQEGP